jgi:hypothetical protein
MIALGVGLRDKLTKTDLEGKKSKFILLFIYGYLMYSKSKFRKTKDDKLLSIANDFELLSSEFDIDFDKETVTNLSEINKDIKGLLK